MSKIFKHLKMILKHKYWVGKYCFKCGIPWQGITHDLSKFSPTEFIESVKYYQGTSSPVEAAKKDKGYSKAWMHHRGRNKHHYEYWQDNFDNGGEPLIIPYQYAVEIFCDYLGAGRAYMGKNFNYSEERKWWLNKQSKPIAMHPAIIMFLNLCFIMAEDIIEGKTSSSKEILKDNYESAIKHWNNGGNILHD